MYFIVFILRYSSCNIFEYGHYEFKNILKNNQKAGP